MVRIALPEHRQVHAHRRLGQPALRLFVEQHLPLEVRAVAQQDPTGPQIDLDW